MPREELSKYTGLELLQRIIDGRYPARRWPACSTSP
jgi:hypothetical protein